MINKYFFKFTISIALATLLLSGCGDSSETKENNTDNQFKTDNQPKTENDIKESELKAILQTRGVEYKNSIYSNDKSKIFLIGTKNKVASIYEFDANSLKLINEYNFNLDGIVDIKNGKDGIYSVTAQQDSVADVYIFDSNEGKLIQKEQIPVDDPKEIIKDKVEKNSQNKMHDFIYSPQKYGAAVLVVDPYGLNYLYLYGLEKPNDPVMEYEIIKSGRDITDIKMLGGGKLSYKIDKTTTIYDYFNKKIISQNSPDSGPKDVMDDYLYKKYKADKKGRGVTLVKFLEVEDELYITTFNYYNPGDIYQETSLFSIKDKKVERVKVLAHIKYGPGGHEIKDIKIDKENNLIIYTTTMNYADIENGKDYDDYWMGDGIKYTYNYKTKDVTRKLPTKPDLSNKVDNLISFERSLKGEGILAIGRDSNENIEFYRFDADSLELEQKFSAKKYGKRYGLGSQTPFIYPKENGVFEISTGFGHYFFNYFTGEGEYQFDNKITKVSDQEIIDKAKSIINQNSMRFKFYTFELYKTNRDSTFIAKSSADEKGGRFEGLFLFSIDLNSNKFNIIEDLGSDKDIELLSIDYPLGNTVLYKKKSHGFDVYTQIVKRYYTKDEIVDQAYLSVGFGG